MATSQDYVQSILTALQLTQLASETAMEEIGVIAILQDMDQLADELREVLG